MYNARSVLLYVLVACRLPGNCVLHIIYVSALCGCVSISMRCSSVHAMLHELQTLEHEVEMYDCATTTISHLGSQEKNLFAFEVVFFITLAGSAGAYSAR